MEAFDEVSAFEIVHQENIEMSVDDSDIDVSCKKLEKINQKEWKFWKTFRGFLVTSKLNLNS